MGLFKVMHRRTWKNAVRIEFQKQHGVDLPAVAVVIGPATLDDLLNDQYECFPRSPALAAENVTRVLSKSFGLNVPLLAMRCRIGAV
jgi:hypothetical protein